MPSIALAASLRVALVRLGRRMRREQGDEDLSIHHMSALGAIQQLEEPTLARIAACEQDELLACVVVKRHCPVEPSLVGDGAVDDGADAVVVERFEFEQQ